jgi:RNA polymerase sigma factor (sigma-70 family)
MIGDNQLIRQYAAERSEPAFAELVRRHLKMVYGAALRQVNGDTHLAEDVAQSVFTDLARKAGKLQHNHSIAGWLHASTRFAAANAVRAEARRRTREQALVSMNEMNSEANPGWDGLRPLIDEALEELGGADREAIVLRYFEACKFSLVGAALGVSENAARMRVDRALEKLRAVLQRRGVAATGAALAGALAESSATVLPAQLAAGITSMALAQGGATLVSSTPSILKIIAMKKLSLAALGALALSVTAVFIVRNSSDPNSQKAAAASANAKQTSPVQAGGSAPSAGGTGDPGLFNKIVQRHDEQVRARQAPEAAEAQARWDKELADFENSMKEEPGVKKFAAKIQATLGPGESLVAGRWRTADGKTSLVFVTPQMNPELAGRGVISNQVLIAPRVIEVPDEVLDRLGMATFKAQPDGANQPETFSSEQANAMFNNITNAAGIASIIFSPRMVNRLGQDGSILIGNEELIAGKQQRLGLKINFYPNRSADGSSLDIGMVVRYTIPTTAQDASAAGQ